MSKNIIIAILTIVSILLTLFAIVLRKEVQIHQMQSYESMQKGIELEKDLMRCKTEAEQQQQRMIQAERMTIEMTNELRLKELAKKK
jgi:predicted Holliday junction resolvase-like endonuclease